MARTRPDAAPEALALLKKRGAKMSAKTRLKTLREAMGLSRDRLATALLCTSGAIAHWEKGRYSPRGEQAARMEAWSKAACEQLGLPVSCALSLYDWLNKAGRAALVSAAATEPVATSVSP